MKQSKKAILIKLLDTETNELVQFEVKISGPELYPVNLEFLARTIRELAPEECIEETEFSKTYYGNHRLEEEKKRNKK